MGRVGVEVLGPFPVTDLASVLVAMDYCMEMPEAYAAPDQIAAATAERLGEEMFASEVPTATRDGNSNA